MSDFIKQRSFEVSYALFQLARIFKQRDLRARIEANAVYLLESSENGDIPSLTRGIAVLKKLVILGEGIGEISYDHSRTINKQFGNLATAIADYSATKQSEDSLGSAINLDGIFEKGVNGLSELQQSGNGNKLSGNGYKRSAKVESDSYIAETNSPNNNGSANRQSAIVGKIRQLTADGDGCRLKDLIAEFPDVSERTLRYDLQKICEQGIIERVGNGGPFSYYRTKAMGASGVLRETSLALK